MGQRCKKGVNSVAANNKRSALVRQLQEKLGIETLITDPENRYALMVTPVGITLVLRHDSQREVFMFAMSGVLTHNNAVATSEWIAVFAQKMEKIQKDLKEGSATVYKANCA